MIHLDRKEFDTKCEEVVKDVSDHKMSSSAWAWMAAGAVAGFVASCVKVKRRTVEPIIGRYSKVKETKDG